MAEKTMFDIIKKQNGERFAKAIRAYDNGIFDIKDIDKIVKCAGRDAEPILQYLVSLKNIQIAEQAVHMDPIELLSRAGYDAYVADTLEKQNAIQKYYAPGEELCTFRDPHRFERYHIINAVRKDVDQIRREDFPAPEREDKYGISVISIQVLKTGGFISIKNRYNHTVPSPDNTLNSNPDNIITGLSDAIKHHFGVDFSAQQVCLPNHYTIINNQIIRFDTESNNVYCAEDFYAKDGVIYEINKDSQIMLGDGLLLDLRTKKVRDITRNPSTVPIDMRDMFIKSINDELAGKKLQLTKNPLGGRDIVADGQVIFTVENGDLVNINLPNAKTIDLSGRKNLRGNLNLGGATNIYLVDVDLTAVTDMTLPTQFSAFNVSDTKFPAIDLDFSGATYQLHLEKADLSKAKSVKMPRDIMCVDLAYSKWPSTELDFSGVKGSLQVTRCNFSNDKNIKMPRGAARINFFSIEFPATVLDLSGITEHVSLENIDLRKVRGMVFPKSFLTADLSGSILPALDIDLSGAKNRINFKDTDLLDCKSIKMPANIKQVDLFRTKVGVPDLDLSGVTKELTINAGTYTDVKSIKMPRQIENINISFWRAPAVDLDLSGVTGTLKLDSVDFSRVKSLKLPAKKNIKILDNVTLPETGVTYAKDKELKAATAVLQSKIANKDKTAEPLLPIKQGNEND